MQGYNCGGYITGSRATYNGSENLAENSGHALGTGDSVSSYGTVQAF